MVSAKYDVKITVKLAPEDIFLEGLVFGGGYLRREICVSK